MATDIDSLQIKINGTAKSANRSINTLIKNLDKLQASLTGLDTSKLNSFSAGSTKASESSKNLSTSLNMLNTSAKKSTSSFKGLASAFGRFYANYFLVVRGIKGFWSSIEGTADYIESFNYYTVAFGKIASQWDENWENYGSDNARNYSNAFVTSMNETLGKLSGVKLAIGDDGQGLLTSTGGNNLGLNIQEITQYASQLASVTNSLGQTGKTSLAISSSFTKLAGDISSLFNVDYSTVAQNLQSGLIGQSRALYKYGIDITNATLQTYAYELGLEKTVAEMTQMEKQQLRVLAILDQSEVAFGDLANTINSPSNMIRQMTNNFKEASIILGQLFMPVVENVLPMINGLSIAIKNFLTDIAEFLGISLDMDAFGQGFLETEDAVDGITESLDGAVESSNKLLNNLRGFDKLNVISTKGSTSGSGLSGALDLTNEIIKATEEYEKKWNEAFANMENDSEKYAEIISQKLEPIKYSLMFVADGDFESAGASLSDSLNEFFTTFDFAGLGEGTSSFVSGLMDFLSGAIGNFPTDSLEQGISDFITNINFGELLISSLNLVESITDLPYEITTSIREAIKNISFEDIVQDFIGAFEDEDLGELLLTHLNVALNIAGLGFVADFVENLGIDDALEELKNHLSQDKLEAVFEAFPTVMEEVFKNIANVGIDVFNSFIDYLNNRLTIKWDAMYFMGNKVFDSGSFKLFEIPNIPKFELGGFPEDGLFFANHNELVGKFSNGQTAVANNEQITKGISDAVYPAVYNAITDAFGGNRNAQKVVVQIDGREVFSVVRSEANNYTRRTGQPAFG